MYTKHIIKGMNTVIRVIIIVVLILLLIHLALTSVYLLRTISSGDATAIVYLQALVAIILLVGLAILSWHFWKEGKFRF